MSILDELKEVHIWSCSERFSDAFVVVEVTNAIGQTKTLVRSNHSGSHRETFLHFLKGMEGGCRSSEWKLLDVKCVGGGRINVDNVEKRIRIQGVSGNYGLEPDRNKTIEALRRAYPNYEVIKID